MSKSNGTLEISLKERTVYGHISIDGERFPVKALTVGEKYELLEMTEAVQAELDKSKKIKELSDDGKDVPDDLRVDQKLIFEQSINIIRMSCPDISQDLIMKFTDDTIDQIRDYVKKVREEYFASE